MKAPGEVTLEGRGKITLRTSNYMTSGGQAAIYKAKNTIIKIYTDLARAHADGSIEKIQHLKQLQHPAIIAPKGYVYDKKKNPIGYFMDYAKGILLPEITSNDGRTRHNIGDKEIVQIVEQMRDIYQAAHNVGATIVDGNELNWILEISKKGPRLKAIDVDAWKINKWPATVIMPSIRDWHTKDFGHKSDWFAFAVVTFQLFTGVHPYKGTLAGYKRGDLERRMQDNKSVFEKGVKLNRAVRDFNCIPTDLLEWYKKVFCHKLREVPPGPLQAARAKQGIATAVTYAATSTQLNLNHTLLIDNDKGKILRTFYCAVVQREDGMLIETRHMQEIANAQMDAELVAVEGGWLLAEIKNEQLSLQYIANDFKKTKQVLALTLQAKALMRSANRLFVFQEDKLVEIKVTMMARPIASIAGQWNAMPEASKLFDGVAIIDAMGATYALIPFGDDKCAKLHIPQLDGRKIIHARAGARFLTVSYQNEKGMIIAANIAFDALFQKYTQATVDIDEAKRNIAILPKGVTAEIIDDGQLEIMVPSQQKCNKIADAQISTQMQLKHFADQVIYLLDGKLWSVKMK